MRIAVNCRSILLENPTGIGRYTYNLLDSLGKIDSQNTYWLYSPKKIFDRKRRLPRFSHPNFKVVTDYLNLGPKYIFKNADIYHQPSPQMTQALPHAKVIVTIHDMIYRTYPQGHTQETIEETARQMESIAKYADHIICISKSTQSDVQRFLNVDPLKTSVVYNGVDHNVFYALKDDELSNARQNLRSLGITKPFILYVGTIEPRKNLEGILRSFARLKEKKIFSGQLAVVGMKGWMMEKIGPLISQLNLKEDVVFCGYISDNQLRELYNLTETFVFPSFYEGFGFPIVEAFCCNAPVITSKWSSCGEIAREAALTIEPNDIEDLTNAMSRVLNDQDLKQDLKQKGLLRAQEFSFGKTAEDTLKIYQKVTNHV